ncbi:MAG: hypothetical protein HYY16_09370 [Planctomycetes bacterium]|nr:hypothetical protein [Planctomycetota bacterium]
MIIADMSIAGILVLVLGGAAVAWLAWVSIQSLRQARVLRASPRGVGGPEGRIVALWGDVRITDPIKNTHGAPCLWHRQVVEERVGWGKNRRWRRVLDQSRAAGFMLGVGAEEAALEELPTEVQGTESQSEFDGGASRVTDRWLPVFPRVTVLGRLVRRGGLWRIVRDPTMGLLMSPHSPEHAACKEWWKGWAGLAGVVAVLAGTVWLYGQVR